MSARPTTSSSLSARWPGLALVAAVALTYWPALQAPFLFDDNAAILHNPTIRHLGSLASFSPPTDGGTTTGRPLVNFTFALNYAISGENPWSYHALNIAIHALAALSLFGLVRRTTGTAPAKSSPVGGPAAGANPDPFFALAVSLLWALHPLLTESVSCAAQRTESLCGLFYLGTLYSFARGLDSSRWLAVSVAACALGMATKEVMVTAPVLVLLYDRTFAAGSFSAAFRQRTHYYTMLAATWTILAVLLARAGGTRGAAAGFGLGVSPWQYLLTQCDALVIYLRLALFPFPLVLDYGTAVANSLADVWWQAGVIVTLLAATGVALCSQRGTARVAGFLGAWFFLILAPSSSIVPLVTQTIAEHRMYLPVAALLIGLGLAARQLFASRATTVLAVLVLLAGGATFARNRVYASEVAVWQDNVAHRPHARALTALGVALLHAGRPAEALPHFARAIALDPSHLSAESNRALALLQLGRANEASTILSALPAREPGEAEEFFALGNAFVREQKFAEAGAAYARTVKLAPDHAAAHANLGNVLLLQERPREAIVHYEAVLRLRPDDARARENLQIAREALR
jgi:Flp pilus assembly protein TadD